MWDRHHKLLEVAMDVDVSHAEVCTHQHVWTISALLAIALRTIESYAGGFIMYAPFGPCVKEASEVWRGDVVS